jgi:acetyl esterase
LFTVAGTAQVLRLTTPVERLPSRPLAQRKLAGRTPPWISGRRPNGVRNEDHVLSTPDGPVRVRMYRPAAEIGVLPVLVYLHGGGWITGSIESTDVLCAEVALRGGFCVASVDYRLAPDAPYPAALDDADAAVRWLEANATSLSVDMTRVAVGGDSAGGNLAAALAIRLRDRGALRLRAQALIYPVLDATLSCPSMTEFTGWGLRVRDMTVYADAYAGAADRTTAELSPLLVADAAGLPPAFLVTAGLDCLRDEGRRYGERLLEAGVRVSYSHYQRLPHGFISLARLCPEAAQVLEEMAAFLREALHRS